MRRFANPITSLSVVERRCQLPGQRHFSLATFVGSTWYAVAVKCTPAAMAPVLTDPCGVAFCFGIGVHLVRLLMMMEADRATARMAKAIPSLIKSFENYWLVAQHEASLKEEVVMAVKHLKQNRKMNMSRHGTSNRRMFGPVIAGFALSSWAAFKPMLQGILPKEQVMTASWISTDFFEMSANGDELSVAAVAVGAVITRWNMSQAIERRKGFGDEMDEKYGLAQKALLGLQFLPPLAVYAATTYLTSPIAATIGPYWLGGALVGLLHNMLMKVKMYRYLLDIPAPPISHGTYGKRPPTGIITHLAEVFDRRSDLEEAAKQENKNPGNVESLRPTVWEGRGFGSGKDYHQVKAQLHVECNARFSKFRRMAGLRTTPTTPDIPGANDAMAPKERLTNQDRTRM